MTISEIFACVDRLFSEKCAEKVEPFLLEQLKEAEAGGDLAVTAAVCNELGGLYRATGRYEEGIPLYQKALAAIEGLGETGTEGHATTLINYGTTYAVKGDVTRGLKIFAEAAKILSALGLDRDYRMATLHNNMSILCQDSGDFDQALLHLERALDILKGLSDSEAEIASTYSNMAQVHLRRGRLDDAFRACEAATGLFEKISGDTDVHYSAAVETRGQIKLASGDTEGALNDFHKALCPIERDYGSNTPAAAALKDLIEDIRSGMKGGGR